MKKGENELLITSIQKVKSKIDRKTSEISVNTKTIYSCSDEFALLGLLPDALTFQTGPILGYAGKNFFTVSCRLNMEAEVILEVNNKQYVSKKALLHSFKVDDLKADTRYEYSLRARLSPERRASVTTGPYVVKTLPAGNNFSFVVLGDNRSVPKNWKRIAAAVFKEQPDFTIFLGDYVEDGRIDHLWDEEVFAPAHELFASIPSYSVIGNHEKNSSLYLELFQSPRSKNWAKEIGPALFIGIDGLMNWTKGSQLTKGLEATLAQSQAKFIFLATHYPAWTSGKYGILDKKGLPKKTSIYKSQLVLMPLLEKYKATAMLAAHEHFYERSEPGGGVSVVTTGGAGVWLRGKVDHAEKQNPFSRVFAKQHHYCLFTVSENKCTMQVISIDGDQIDSYTWNGRKIL